MSFLSPLPQRHVLFFLLVTIIGVGHVLAEAPPVPRVAIFVGLPGDAERYERYLATTNALKAALTSQAHIPAADIEILFGKGKPSPYRECSISNIARELDAMQHRARDRRPVWIFVLGHANTVKDKVFLNLPGKDVEMREFAKLLDGLPHYTPQIVFMTTAASGNCLGTLSGGNRCVVVATQAGADDNETEFPHVLAKILAEARRYDANADGRLSVNEMVSAVRQDVKAWYSEQRAMPTESPQIDADGDGKPLKAGTKEEQRAELFALELNTQ